MKGSTIFICFCLLLVSLNLFVIFLFANPPQQDSKIIPYQTNYFDFYSSFSDTWKNYLNPSQTIAYVIP